MAFMKILKKLQDLKSRQKELEDLLHSGFPPDQRANLMKEYAELSGIMELYDRYQDLEKNILKHKNLLSEDKELCALAEEELALLRKQRDQTEKKLQRMLVPKDPLDKKNALMEIRAGAGGAEACLFCEDLFAMYSRYIAGKKWSLDIVSFTSGTSGGFKEIIFSVSGSDVYGFLRYESGVHRVQRVPKTETQGRVHTSTVTVAVLPSVEEKELKINPADLRTDTFRSRGAGGQHVNTTDSAVRVVHLPSKITVQCQDEKSQHANKEKALKVLRARLHEKQREEKKQKEDIVRLSQIGTGDRSEKIRTYNFSRLSVTDHRISLSLSALERVMAGELDDLINPLKTRREEKLLENLNK